MTESRGSRVSVIPAKALLLSLGALAIPVISAFNAPDWMGGDVEVLMWLTALLPAFVLTYYKGWRGVSLALATGMAVLTLTQVAVLLWGTSPVNWKLLAAVVMILVGVSLGLGYFAELLNRERRRAETQSLSDPLTGLPNRRHSEVFLETAFSAAGRGADLCVVIFDLDHFKSVNDEQGHQAGDQVLRIFGGLLHKSTRRMDLSARFGGEEFISILPHCTLQGAGGFACRVLDALRDTRFDWGAVTVSAGVAAYEEGMGSSEFLIAAADRALYQAKEGGRDQAVISSPVGREPSLRPALSRDGPLAWGRTIDPPQPAQSKVSAEKVRMNRGPVAVLVDDDPLVAESVRKLLRALGFRTQAFTDPKQALEVISGSTTPVDILLTDVVMPSMNGLTLVEKISASRSGLPVLYMSGFIQGEVTWPGIPGAETGFIQKPFTLEELKEKLAELVDFPESEQTLAVNALDMPSMDP